MTQTSQTTPKGGHLTALDGLRAVAVVLVLGYHLLPEVVPNGILGVDVFFVLSGFLITALLIGEFERTNRISLVNFTKRRFRRLVPAMWLTVLSAATLAFLVGGDALLAIRRQIIGSLTFTTNWIEIFAGSSYFDHTQPLLFTHMWSLAVEAQFYLVWPLVLFFALQVVRPTRVEQNRRHRFHFLGMVALAIAFISAMWALFLLSTGANPSRVHMGTDTHAFGLMLGAAVALWRGRGLMTKEPGHPYSAQVLIFRGWIGVAGVVGIIVLSFVNPASAGNGALATLSLIAASACAAGVVQAVLPEVSSATPMSRVLTGTLALRPFTWIGERSYGIYLWHWPLVVLAFYAFPDADPLFAAFIVAFLSVLASHVSFSLIETPVRKVGVPMWIRRTINEVQPARRIAALVIMTVLILGSLLAFLQQQNQSTAQEVIEQGAGSLATNIHQGDDGALPGLAEVPSHNVAQSGQETSQSADISQSAKPAPAEPEKPAVSFTGENVSLVGDSVSLASVNALTQVLPGIAIDASVSRSIFAAADGIGGLDAKHGPRSVVAISLATNSAVKPEHLDAILQQIGPDRRLILVTAYGPKRTTWIPPSNAAIREFAAAHPNQVRVADWEEVIKDKTNLLAQDRVHPGNEGATLYAQELKRALESF